MKIDAYMQVNQIYQASKPRAASKSPKGDESDKLEISSLGKDYQVARKASSEASDVREDKVKDIMERMKAGTYNVSLEDVAENLAERLLG
ncbi:MAG: flagellar biosynthesis anti-sigma factor FlgM [Roseburia sp.]|nr:flagellar biosynthesis anti-sigma factor FlgM [Roseburia sp.]